MDWLIKIIFMFFLSYFYHKNCFQNINVIITKNKTVYIHDIFQALTGKNLLKTKNFTGNLRNIFKSYSF